eukprot:TRINITY_DN18872_c0_g1_i1.p1 TRINITY_DN18872_c0_g1~~TRINITY_DN18872_c0_g1_i1.p1  ORF type:complete len:1136 (+),score=352.05 TRINITY_DN18872_c0_g1_i1:92-3499(+)
MRAASALLALLLPAAALGYIPWPEKPGMDGGQFLPDLSGAWLSSGGSEHFLSRGQDPRRPAAMPNSTYDEVGLSSNRHRTCLLEEDAAGLRLRCSGSDGEAVGQLTAGTDLIQFGGGERWQRARGTLAGLWHRAGGGPTDFAVLTHDAPTDPVKAWRRSGGEWRAEVMSLDGTAAVSSGRLGRGRVAGAAAIEWSDGTEWRRHPSQTLPSATPIHTVHMVYMNHYDVGYTSFINNVDNEYLHKYYSLAANTADQMRASGSNDSFVYTTHPWLMRRFLECPCPDPPRPPAPLEGVWTGSPLGGADHRYYFSGVEAGQYAVKCLTSQWRGGSAGGCGWGAGNCTLSGATVSCALDNGAKLSGPVQGNGSAIGFALPWRRFTGAVSGLWYGPSDVQDYYVAAHNATSGELTVWWDVSISKRGWAYGSGSVTGSSVSLLIPDYSKTALEGTLSPGQITWKGSAGTWHEHGVQCYPGACKSTACPARTLGHALAPPLTCPSAAELSTFTAAAKRGDIVWHAQPFNLESENMSPELFKAGLDEFVRMDKRFYGEQRTITASDRDVIYVTRSIIPLLRSYNVTGLTIGSNGANYPPQVPKLHRWLDTQSGKDVVVAYHPYGYGGYGKSDCAESPNGFALCTEFRSDNTGPPSSVKEVTDSLSKVRAEYPGARVIASTFDNFMRDVLPVKDQLPLVTGEVGDTWMYGVPADPLKMAQNRAIQRAWIACMRSGEPRCQPDHPEIQNMTWFALKAPEHTWGIPGISGWGGGNDYDKQEMHGKLKSSAYLNAAATWAEQRFYNELAVRSLEESGNPLGAVARREMDALTVSAAPDLGRYTKAADPTAVQTVRGVKVGLDSTGAITTLTDAAGHQWASQSARLAAFSYQTLNETQWKPFTYGYINGHGESGGFCKPGSNKYSEGRYWLPELQELWVSPAMGSVVAVLQMPSAAHDKYGAPGRLYLNLTVASGAPLAAELELVWMAKEPVMIGESSSISFTPAPALQRRGNSSAWTMDKLGGKVDPEDVINGGNQFNHGIWGAVAGLTESGEFSIESLDAPNVNPITADFPYGNPLPSSYDYSVAHSKEGGLQPLGTNSVKGFAVNLHNNLWNTNYPLFYPYYDPLHCKDPLSCSNANTRFRFRITCG